MTEGVSWEQFVSRTSQHGRDTPYLLLYHRVSLLETEEVVPADDKLNRVISDNIRYVRDSQRLGSNVPGSNKRSNGGEDDDQGGGCRDNFGQMGGGRFVC